jgi:hypothetical protein
VRHVEVRVSAVEDNYLDLGVGFQAVDEGGQARDDLGVVQVDRRVVEGDPPVGGAVLADADWRLLNENRGGCPIPAFSQLGTPGRGAKSLTSQFIAPAEQLS